MKNWVIRFIYTTQSGIMDELIRCDVKVAALQEIKWKGKGIRNKKNCVILFSGAENAQGQEEVGFIDTCRPVISLSVNKKFSVLRMKQIFNTVTFVNVYSDKGHIL